MSEKNSLHPSDETIEALKLEQERLKRVIEASNTGIWEWNLKTNEVYYSPRWKEILGYQDQELENSFDTWQENLHPDDQERMFRAVTDFINNPQGNFDHEFRMKHKEGHYVWIQNRSSVSLDNDGNTHFMSGSHLDITTKKKIEEEIAKTNKKFRDFFEYSPLGKSITSLDGKLSINKRFSEITGYSEEELNQKNWKDITVEEDIPGSEAAIQEMLQSKKPVTFKKRYIHKDGHIVWTQVRSFAQRDEEGKPLQFLTTIDDITEDIRIENELKESEARLRFLIQSMTIPLCQLDSGGKFVWMNDQFTKKFGYTMNEMAHIDEWWTQAYPDQEYRNWVVENWTNAVNHARINNTDIKSDEYLVRCKNGTDKNIIIGGLPLENGFLATFIDITQIKKAEEDLKTANTQLNNSNKELEHFAYVASHDLQEPLRKVKNYMELFESRYGENFDERAKKYLHIVTSGVSRMQVLIDDLLQLSRISTRAKEFEPVDLNDVLKHVLENLELKIKEKKAVIESNHLPIVMADPMQQIQLFQNLISNAIKYNHQTPKVQINAQLKNKSWHISVQDNGIGLDEKFKDRIFVAFQRLHARQEYEGSGMGLAICKKIVARHGGKITVKSKPEEGATFTFTIKK